MDSVTSIGEPIGTLNPNDVGRKGWRLLEMAEVEEFNVPGGAIATTEVYESLADEVDLEWIDENGDVKLEEVENRIDDNTNPNESLQEIYETTREEFLDAELPEEFKDELNEALSEYEAEEGVYETEFVVRSNAVNEDRADASGAGKMKSKSGAQNIDEIAQFYKEVCASAFSPDAIDNLMEGDNDLEKFGGQGVVIQEQVNPEAGMIIDSKDVGRQDKVKIDVDETPWAVADGGASDIYFVDRETGAIEHKNNDGNPEILNDEKIREGANLATMVELAYGNEPTDIEAVVPEKEDEIYIVQARPMTDDFSAESPYEKEDLPAEFEEKRIAYSETAAKGIGVVQAPAVVMSYADTDGGYEIKREGLPEDLQQMEEDELLSELDNQHDDGYIVITEVANENITELTTNKAAYVAPGGGSSCHASRAAADEEILYLGATENHPQDGAQTGETHSLAVNHAAEQPYGMLAEGQILDEDSDVYVGDGNEI
jgi:phosphoenolpyruvate synthase/pyruvate phosphate dikinase